MGATHEWIDARTERPAWVTTEELRDMMLDDDSEVGPYALLVHSGCGDGALICGDGPQLAMYLSRAAVLLSRRTGASLHPQACRARAEELVNGAANDVLAWLRQAGIDVDEGSAIASVIDLLVNVVLCRAKSRDPVSVESAMVLAWPDEDIETVLGRCSPWTVPKVEDEVGEDLYLLNPVTVAGLRGPIELGAFVDAVQYRR